MNLRIITTPRFGSITIFWDIIISQPKVTRILLSSPDSPAERRARQLFPAAKTTGCPEIETVCSKIIAFLNGDTVAFSKNCFNITDSSDFQQKVFIALQSIPRGRVTTYKNIAASLGIFEGARAVGNALRNNPFPLILPCHRVIRSDRHIGEYQGGSSMKRTLLVNEGVVFDERGKVAGSK